MLHADGQTDMKVIVASRNFNNAHSKKLDGILMVSSAEPQQQVNGVSELTVLRRISGTHTDHKETSRKCTLVPGTRTALYQ